jgi:hypothetical protein
MDKRFLAAWVTIFIVWMAGSFVVHGLLLGADYGAFPDLYRGEAGQARLFPLMLLAHVILAGAFVWIYGRGVEDTPWIGQGFRFGVAVALLTAVPTYLIYYTVQPLTYRLVVKQILFDGILLVLLGLLVAYLYRGKRAPAQARAGSPR